MAIRDRAGVLQPKYDKEHRYQEGTGEDLEINRREVGESPASANDDGGPNAGDAGTPEAGAGEEGVMNYKIKMI
jgi:hypothetical protein